MYSWHVILDIAAGLIVIGFLLAGIYEVAALISSHIPFIPTISDIVRPLIASNRDLAYGLAILFFAATEWLFLHFFFPGKG